MQLIVFFEPINLTPKKKKKKNPKKPNVRRVLLNIEISKHRETCKHYNKKLFVRNYF